MIKITEIRGSNTKDVLYDNIKDIDLSGLENGARYIGSFTVKSVLDEITYNFSFGETSNKIKNYSGDKKLAVIYDGYSNSGWSDSDNTGELLNALDKFYKNEGIL